MATFVLDRKRLHDGDDDDGELVSSRPLHKMRAENYAAEVPCTDWVLSTTAPNHVAVSRASFTKYTEFQSVVRFGKTGTHSVVGIGEVGVEALIKPGSSNSKLHLLLDVLHIPGLISNIYSITRVTNRGLSLSLVGELAHISVGGEACHYAEKHEGLYRLALPIACRRPSKLVQGENCVLAFDWPMPERHAWEIKKAQIKQEQEPEASQTQRTLTPESISVTSSLATRPVKNKCPGCNKVCYDKKGLDQHRQQKRH